jgi:hypothetical protein
VEVLGDHALRIEKRPVHGNRMPHHLDKTFMFLVKTRQDLFPQLSFSSFL